MLLQTPYRVATKYETLAKKAFEIVRKAIIEELNEIQEYGHLGIEITKQRVERYYHLINYLLHVRTVLDNHLQATGKTCISEEDFEKLRAVYLIDCIIEEGVCDKYTNNLINLIVQAPFCESASEYYWTGVGLCTNINGQALLQRVNLVETKSDVVIDVLSIPENIDIEVFRFYVPNATEELLQARFIEDNSSNCCIEELPEIPTVSVLEVRNTDITVSWSGSTSYIVRLFQADNQLLTIETTDTSRTFDNLELNTQYRVEVEISNCAGSSTGQVQVTTLPYTVSISLCPEIENQIQIVGAQIGDNLVTDYQGTFTFNFLDNNAPFYEIDSILVNGVDYLNNVIFNVMQGSVKTGGTVVLNGITENKNIEMCGSLGNTCQDVTITYDTGIDGINIV